MKLIFVRHGQTYSNERGVLDTIVPGAALTETGWMQANEVVSDLSSYQPDALWRSDTLRTEQTATPLATHLNMPVQVHAGLREVSAGELEGSAEPAAMQEYLATMRGWFDGQLELKLGNGDTGTETLARFDRAIADIVASGAQCPVIFAHAAIIFYWVGMRCSGITEPMIQQRLTNTGIVVVSGDLDRGFGVERWMNIYQS